MPASHSAQRIDASTHRRITRGRCEGFVEHRRGSFAHRPATPCERAGKQPGRRGVARRVEAPQQQLHHADRCASRLHEPLRTGAALEAARRVPVAWRACVGHRGMGPPGAGGAAPPVVRPALEGGVLVVGWPGAQPQAFAIFYIDRFAPGVAQDQDRTSQRVGRYVASAVRQHGKVSQRLTPKKFEHSAGRPRRATQDIVEGIADTTSTATPVWFITGRSTGFGSELATLVLARGWRAVVTARDKVRIADLMQGAEDRALALVLDVTDVGQIAAAVAAAERRFGNIDVPVNNAGYGYQASVEEGAEAETRQQFDANAFGLFAMTRAMLPGMKAWRRGHVLNITSVAGLIGFPGSGYYAASKHAVEGWSDALTAEGKPLGIKVTCIEPGTFCTDWAGRSLKQTPNRMADCADTAGTRLAGTARGSGNHPGDPARAALAMVRITAMENPPRHLVLAAFGIDAVTAALKKRMAEVEQWRDMSLATDFPKD